MRYKMNDTAILQMHREKEVGKLLANGKDAEAKELAKKYGIGAWAYSKLEELYKPSMQTWGFLSR